MGVSVRAEGVSFSYHSGRREVPVLRELDLDLEAGAYVSLMGSSGAGKSTLLGLLGGLIPPQQGTLAVGDRSLTSMRNRALAGYRRSVIGFVFQHSGLVDVLTAQENVELALGLDGVPRKARRSRAREALDSVDLASRATHRPSQLSGGERQRVSIARALVTNPELILADEPTGNLDEETSTSILDLMERIREDHGCTLVVVTHNSSVARRAPRTLVLDNGRLRIARRRSDGAGGPDTSDAGDST
ncbi:MAG: ABC transporter ATP-binding protein [Candidatus Dormibacteria bacterium]